MADPNQLSRQERRLVDQGGLVDGVKQIGDLRLRPPTGAPGRLALCPLGAAELVLDQPAVPRGEHAAHDALHFPLAGRRVGRSPSRQRDH